MPAAGKAGGDDITAQLEAGHAVGGRGGGGDVTGNAGLVSHFSFGKHNRQREDAVCLKAQWTSLSSGYHSSSRSKCSGRAAVGLYIQLEVFGTLHIDKLGYSQRTERWRSTVCHKHEA